jgi:hypothetical protein
MKNMKLIFKDAWIVIAKAYDNYTYFYDSANDYWSQEYIDATFFEVEDEAKQCANNQQKFYSSKCIEIYNVKVPYHWEKIKKQPKKKYIK